MIERLVVEILVVRSLGVCFYVFFVLSEDRVLEGLEFILDMSDVEESGCSKILILILRKMECEEEGCLF